MGSLRICSLLALLAILSAGVFAAQETIIQSVAGGGNLGGYTPNKAAVNFNNTSGLVLNPITKELYFSDTTHHQVYKVNSTTGLIELVAGNGTESFSGDGSVAVAAGLDTPGALAFNAAGTLLYIADNGNFRVRKVDLVTSLISTFAGNGLSTNTPLPAGDGGLATAASFGGNANANIAGIAVAADGAVLLSDTPNNYVRRVTADGNIAAFAGTFNTGGNGGDGAAASAATLNGPRGLCFDDAGNLYIATTGGNRVRKVDTAAVITTLSGTNAVIVPDANGDGGNADVAQLAAPASLAFDKTKKFLYVGSLAGGGAIRLINLGVTPPTITSLVGAGGTTDGGPAGANAISTSAMATDDLGNLYILDFGNDSIRRIDVTTGFADTVLGLTTVFGQIGDRSPGFTPVLETPEAIALDDAGNIYIADTGSSSVRRIKTDGTVDTVAGTGTAGFSGDGGPGFQATLSNPTDLEVIGTNLYIADNGNGVIRVVDLGTGLIRTLTDATNGGALSIAKDPAGNLVVGTDNNVVQRVTVADGTVTDFAGTAPAAGPPQGQSDAYVGAAVGAQIQALRGLAVAPNGDVFITENAGGSGRVRRFSADGTTTTRIVGSNTLAAGFVGDGGDALLATFTNIQGIAVTSNGNLIISDSGNQRLRLVNTGVTPNIITTAAGDGTAGLTGDGGLAALARVNGPQEIIDVGGVIFFADTGNNRIRTLTNATVIDPKFLAFSAKLSFAKDKKTGLQIRGKDSVQLKAGLLPLPAGIAGANLILRVDIVDLHDQIQLDANGKLPKAVKPPKASKTTPLFNYTQYKNTTLLSSKFSFSVKTTTTGTETKPLSFGYSAKGTFSDDLGRAGFINKTTTGKSEQITGVRVNITLDGAGVAPATFTGVITADYKATLDKSGAAKSIKTK